MFVEEKNLDFEIIDVLRFKRKSIYYSTLKRQIAVISCRLSGETDFFCNGETIHASEKDYIIIPSNIEYEQNSSDEEVICIHLSPNDNLSENILSFHSGSPVLQQLFLSIYKEWHKKKNGYMLKCKSLTYEILHEFCLIDEKHADNKILDNSMKYIYDNYRQKEFSINNAIELSYVSPAYFRRIFKKIYNTSPNAFINNLKIEYAKSLLTSYSYTIAEIAEMAGFSDEKYFYTVFKNITGTTPSKWLL